MSAERSPDRRARIGRVLLLCGGLAVLLLIYLVWVGVTGRGIPCLIHAWTGLSCGSCGLTRALVAVGRLDFFAAFDYNRLWPLYVAWTVWVAAANGCAYVHRGRILGLPGPAWVHGAFVALVTVYGILRNVCALYI